MAQAERPAGMGGLAQGRKVSARAEADLSLGEVQGRDAVTLQTGPSAVPRAPDARLIRLNLVYERGSHHAPSVRIWEAH